MNGHQVALLILLASIGYLMSGAVGIAYGLLAAILLMIFASIFF